MDKNAIGEKVCRACYWREWYRGEEDIHYTNGMSLVEAKQRFVAAGMEEAPVDMSEAEARAMAHKNGYELVELLQGGAFRGAASCRPLRELRQADGGARGRRRLRLHLREVEEVDGAVLL